MSDALFPVPDTAMESRTDSHRCNGTDPVEAGHHKDLNTAASCIIRHDGTDRNREPAQSDAQDELLRSVPNVDEDSSVTSLPDTKEEEDEEETPLDRSDGLQPSNLQRDGFENTKPVLSIP